MNFVRAAQSGALIAITGVVTVTSFGTTATLSGCGESGTCSRLRDDTFSARQTWESCDPLTFDPCIQIAGNPKDCTGVLSCNFAVNPMYRTEAEQAVLTMGEKSQGCYLCAVPNCSDGKIAFCDPASRRCELVEAVLDGGVVSVGVQAPDTGTSPPDDSGVPPTSDAGTTPATDAGGGSISLPL